MPAYIIEVVPFVHMNSRKPAGPLKPTFFHFFTLFPTLRKRGSEVKPAWLIFSFGNKHLARFFEANPEN
jgi:hypothetical protein